MSGSTGTEAGRNLPESGRTADRSDTKPYKDLSEEMKGYVSYIVNDLLMDKTGILSETSIDKNDEMYKAWTKDETISLQEYLTYAASQNWIDISKFQIKHISGFHRSIPGTICIYFRLSVYGSGLQ